MKPDKQRHCGLLNDGVEKLENLPLLNGAKFPWNEQVHSFGMFLDTLMISITRNLLYLIQPTD